MPGSSPPGPAPNGTGANLGGGNAPPWQETRTTGRGSTTGRGAYQHTATMAAEANRDEKTSIDSATARYAAPLCSPSRRRGACYSRSGVLLPAAARRTRPITSFSIHSHPRPRPAVIPTSQLIFTVGNRDTQNIPQPIVNCQDAKNITVNLPAGVIGDPARDPPVLRRRFRQSRLSRSTHRSERSGSASVPERTTRLSGSLAGLQPGSASRQAGLLGLQHSDLRTFANFIDPQSPGPRAITVSRRRSYGIIHTTSAPLDFLRTDHLWGVPADQSRCHTDWAPVGCDPNLRATRSLYPADLPPTAPSEPFLDNPTTCGVRSAPRSTSSPTTTAPPTPKRLSGDHRLRSAQLQPEPLRPADHHRRPTRPRASTSTSRSPRRRARPSPRLRRSAPPRSPCPQGFSINPNAADGKTSCTDAEAQLRHRGRRPVPRVLQGRHPHDRQLRPAGPAARLRLPRPAPARQPLPHLPRRRRLRRPRQARRARSPPIRRPGSSSSPSRTCRRLPFSDFNLHFFGSERGLLATPTQCGTYPVNSTFTPWDSVLPEQTSTQFFTLDSGPTALPARPRSRPFTPSFHAGVGRQHRRRPHPLLARPHPPRRRPEPQRPQRHDPARASRPPWPASPTARRPRSPRPPTPATRASPSRRPRAVPPPARSAPPPPAPAPAPTPSTFRGKVYLAGPYKGAPLSLAVITPAVSGPYDLGNVVVRAALHVDPTTAQITAVSDPLPQILEASRCGCARSWSTSTARTSPSTRPTAIPSRSTRSVFGDQGAQADLASPLPGRQLRQPPLRPQARAQAHRRHQANGNPALTRDPHLPARRSQHRPRPRSPCPHRDLDNAHIQGPCTRVQFAANACPAGSVIGTAKAETPLLDKPSKAPST